MLQGITAKMVVLPAAVDIFSTGGPKAHDPPPDNARCLTTHGHSGLGRTASDNLITTVSWGSSSVILRSPIRMSTWSEK